MSYVSDRPTSSTSAETTEQTVEQSTRSSSPLPQSLESSAEALIDDVFADIERMIERGAAPYLPAADDAEFFERLDLITLKDEPEDPDTIFSTEDLDSSESEALAVLPKVSPRELTMGEADVDADVLLDLARESQAPQEKRQSIDALLVSVVVATLAITGGVWLYLRQPTTPQGSPPSAEGPSPAEVLAAQRDADFLDYVRRSVERIDRSKKQADALTSADTQPNPTVLERIYIPFYQPPSVTGSPNIAQLPAPAPGVPVPIPPAPPSIAAQPPAPVPAPDPAVSVIPNTVVPNIVPSPSHVLIGLLELGDRSAALFEIEGTPHRIQVGERIGSSGWTLVSIANQEALIRRNGEVRSIYIGQQF